MYCFFSSNKYSPRKFTPLRRRQNCPHFAGDILKGISLNEKGGISIEISLKFVPKGPDDNLSPLV